MNKNIYTSAFYSLTIQFIIAFLCLFGIFIKIDKKDHIVNEILILETVVQFIEIGFYIWLVYKFSSIKIDVSIIRYFDWFITTPTMLLSLIAFMVYYDYKTRNIDTTNLSIYKIFNDNKNLITQILLFNSIMLILGFLGELKFINKINGFLFGTFFLFAAFFLIYKNFANNQLFNLILLWFNLFLWALYGISYLFNYDLKNIFYNILDIFSKNINGLLILAYTIFIYYN